MTDAQPTLCDFCDELAVWTNCFFYPGTQEESISGPFDMCQRHYEKYDDDYMATGDELLIGENTR